MSMALQEGSQDLMQTILCRFVTQRLESNDWLERYLQCAAGVQGLPSPLTIRPVAKAEYYEVTFNIVAQHCLHAL